MTWQLLVCIPNCLKCEISNTLCDDGWCQSGYYRADDTGGCKSMSLILLKTLYQFYFSFVSFSYYSRYYDSLDLIYIFAVII